MVATDLFKRIAIIMTNMSYLYDTNGQIKKANLPDGSSVSFQYEWYRSKEAKDAALKKIKVTHTTAKVVSSPTTGGKSP